MAARSSQGADSEKKGQKNGQWERTKGSIKFPLHSDGISDGHEDAHDQRWIYLLKEPNTTFPVARKKRLGAYYSTIRS